MKTMRVILVVMTISFLPSFSKTPVQVNAKTTRNSESSLIVEFSPSVMTAGVVNEFIDAREPFTITVRDSQGVPVDLTNGGKNDARTVWNKCFLDPHPDNQEYYGKDAKLPQYYWTRTDMHNDDGTAVCNKKLFGKDSIEINFSQASKGVYIFNNFVANDRGEFKVYVKTLDGKKEGNCNVKIERPRVDYYIINIEDNMLVPYATPGDPDFVMTAADNRIYRIRPTCYTANGRLIKGGDFGGINPARFTPMLQMPGNTLWAKEPDQKDDRNIYGSGTCKYLTNIGGRYSLNLGCDFNGDYRIIEEDNEKFSFGPQQIYDISLKKWTSYLTYYSCFNTYSDSSGYSTKPAFDMPVGNNKGWGLGCIYNRDFVPDTTYYAKDEPGYMFINIDDDPRITHKDSLGLDVNAQIEIVLEANDVGKLGCLVGCSKQEIYDFAGCPPSTPTSPNKVETRYKPDGVYCLDFDAMPSEKASIDKPRIAVLSSATKEELLKDYFNPHNYDLVDGIENNFTLLVKPADPRDLPMHDGSTISLVDKREKELAVGETKHSAQEEKAVETTFSLTPTINGQGVYEVRYFTQNSWYKIEPYNSDVKVYELRELAYFDVMQGIVMKVEFDKTPIVGEKIQITVTCIESGSKTPIAGALVRLSGCHADFERKTDSSGKITQYVTFSQACKAKIEASQDGYAPGQPFIFEVDGSNITPPLENPLPPTLIKPENKSILTDSTMPNKLVLEWSKPANWNNTMEYILEISKWDDAIGGLKQVFKLTTSTSESNVVFSLTSAKGFSLDYGTKYYWHVASRFTTGNKTAPEWSPMWEFTTPDNTNGSDATDCPDECMKTMDFKIDSKDWKICDRNQPQMTAAPVIRNGKTFLVIKYIAETIGATVNWYAEQKVVEIISPSDLTTIYLQIDNNEAEVNGKLVKIDDNKDVKPFIVGGRTMLPLRFISENLGLEVQWNGNTRTVGIGFKPPECKPKIDFTLKDTTGKLHTLSSYRGKPVILDFTASWCGWCIKAAPDLDAVAKKYKGRVQVFSIDMGEDQATAKKFREDLKADWPFLVDTDKKVSGQFRVNGIPNFVILDGNGVVRFIQSGYNDQLVEIFSKEIEKWLK